MLIEVSRLDSPLGGVVLAVTDQGLAALDFADSDRPVRERLLRAYPAACFENGPRAEQLAAQVMAYFDGDLQALAPVQVAPAGTAFQKQVWSALRNIPVGATCSYARLAAAIGKPKAVRAVGSANGQNPIALVVPCHRVIAADGTLCGYAGGLWRKQWLLKHERALLA